MRIQWPHVRGGIAGIVLAATCASGVHLAGCAKPSPRQLSSDLTKKSRPQETLSAQDLAQGNSAPARRVQFSPGPDFVDVKDSVGGETLASKLAESNRRILSESNPIDPNARSAAATPISRVSHELGNPFESSLSASEPAGSTERHAIPSDVVIDLESLLPNSTSELDVRPFPTENEESAVAAPKTSSVATVHLKQTLIFEDETPSVPTSPINPLQNADSELNIEKSAIAQASLPSEPESVAVDQRVFDSGAPRTANLVTTPSVEAAPSEQQLAVIHPRKSVQQVTASEETQEPISRKDDARNRMEQLISMAKTHQIRGEMHAAYRSALLARHIAEKHELTIDFLDQCPSALTEEIASQLWRIPSEDPRGLVASPGSPLPSIQPRDPSQSGHERVFADRSTPQEWELLDNVSTTESREEHRKLISHDSDPLGSFESTLPAMEPVSDAAIAQALEMEPVADPLMTPGATETLLPLPADCAQEAPETAQLAMADIPQDVAGLENLQPIPTMASSPADPFTDSVITDSTIEEHAEIAQPAMDLLLAAHPPEAISTPLEIAEFPTATNTDKSEVKAKSTSNLRWGGLAFILATVLAMLGSRLSRSQPTKQDVAKEEVATKPTEKVELKVRRAA